VSPGRPPFIFGTYDDRSLLDSIPSDVIPCMTTKITSFFFFVYRNNSTPSADRDDYGNSPPPECSPRPVLFPISLWNSPIESSTTTGAVLLGPASPR
jgi:hypothetical protein